MTDILERLQVLHAQTRISPRPGDGDVSSIARDAAEEISDLRDRVLALEDLLTESFATLRLAVT